MTTRRLVLSLLLALATTVASVGYGAELLVKTTAESENLVCADGRASSWRNEGALGGAWTLARGAATPSADGRAVNFESARFELSADRLESLRSWTILAVARADAPMSIGVLSSREDRAPLVQLDVDENDRVRFVARDAKGATLRATAPLPKDRAFVVAVSVNTTDDGVSHARLTVNKTAVEATERLNMPVWSKRLQLGGLDAAGMSFSWRGTVSELELWDGALANDAIERWLDAAAKRRGIDRDAPMSAFNDSWNVLTRSSSNVVVSRELETDVCVIGAGGAGVAAALAAAREGANVVLIERQKRLGGTGVNAFVSNWEGGPGDATARELFERMKAIGGAGVAREKPHPEIKFPMGLKIVDENEPYENSLMRANPPEGGYRSVAYLPSAYDRVAREMLDETGRVVVLDETTFFHAEPNDAKTRVGSALVERANEEIWRVNARVFIDATGDVWLCRDLGIPTSLGIDSRADYDELGAPEFGSLQLNAISRCYLIEPRENPKREEIAPEDVVAFPQCAYVSGWENGPRAVNTLAALPGSLLVELGYDECVRRSEKVVRNHWRWLQTQPGFENYELVEIAPMLGIREGYRVRTKYVLHESDLADGWEKQPHKDMIAVADHPCDVHGAGGMLKKIETAYGVPYRCLLPDASFENLLVACRGAGFSRIAASSCRLQRTMGQLGTAAGIAAAWAACEDCGVEKIDVDALVKKVDARKNYPN